MIAGLLSPFSAGPLPLVGASGLAVTVSCGLDELSVNVPQQQDAHRQSTGWSPQHEGSMKHIPSDNIGSRNTISIRRRRQLRLLLLDDGGCLGRRRRHSKTSRGMMRKSEIQQKTLVDNEAGDELNSVIEKKTEKEREGGASSLRKRQQQ